jgi:hypothetical protein
MLYFVDLVCLLLICKDLQRHACLFLPFPSPVFLLMGNEFVLLAVVVSPHGMRGRLTGCCPGDLVKHVYGRYSVNELFTEWVALYMIIILLTWLDEF